MERSGRLMVVHGPAGIGKTWLLEEWSRRWRGRGVRIAEIRGTGRDRTTLGPLYGNPGTVRTVLQALNDEGRLAEDGCLSIVEPTSPIALPIALPIDHHLMRRAVEFGEPAMRLIAVTAAEGTLDVDDLPTVAAALGVDVETCGRTVDRLVENGLLVSDPLGRLRCVCAALSDAAAPPRRSITQTGRQSTGRRVSADLPSQARSPRWSATEVRITELISTSITNRQIASKLRSGCRSRVALLAKAAGEGRLWVTHRQKWTVAEGVPIVDCLTRP